jgi:hypothetical protein
VDNQFKIKKDLSVSMVKANLYSLLFALPVFMVLTTCYLLLWGVEGLYQARLLIHHYPLPSITILIGGIILHELIHGISWIIFGKKSFRDIKFGMSIKTLTPYAHCRKPLNVRAYRLGALMPGLILGTMPALAGLLSSEGWLMGFGMLFTIAAGGDALIIWLTRHEHPADLALDHPSRAGCYIVEPDTLIQ